jgi:hypothetical protein
MKLINCSKPEGKLEPIDTPLNVRGNMYQSYRRENGTEYPDYFEHNQTQNTWMRLQKEETCATR